MSIADKYRPYYTYDDYCHWEGKWELIEGMPYAMSPAPIPAHQRVNANLFTAFETALKNSCKKCKTYIPIDWKIAEDTVVQPDLLVVCSPIQKKYLDFLPVLIAEVLSPSTADKDRNEKMELYLQQGVKYYLILDPHFKKTEVYELLQGSYLPVAINPLQFSFTMEDDCTAMVDFSDIWE